MDLTTRIFGQDSRRSGSEVPYGGHALSTASLMAQTDPNAITPTHPGNLSNIRTNPVLIAPRTFTREEADRMEIAVARNEHAATATVRALRAMGKQESLDATVQTAYRNYQGKVAKAEVRKVSSNARLGKQLHGMRAQYAALGAGLQNAEMTANTMVSTIKARLMGV